MLSDIWEALFYKMMVHESDIFTVLDYETTGSISLLENKNIRHFIRK